jgi:hypothetical protein
LAAAGVISVVAVARVASLGGAGCRRLNWRCFEGAPVKYEGNGREPAAAAFLVFAVRWHVSNAVH